MGFTAFADRFLKRTIEGAISFFTVAVFSEEIASARGMLQAVEPRIKILGLVCMLVWISFVREAWALAVIYAASLVLAAASRIRAGYFIARVWIFIPLFALIIALPAAVWYGPASALILVLRVAASVSFATLLVLTTKKARLIRSLSVLGVPRVFLQTLDMMYTYVFLLVKNLEEMHMALTSRLARALPHGQSRRWIASRISALYIKSRTMSEQVYQAMVARGYTGECKAREKRKR